MRSFQFDFTEFGPVRRFIRPEDWLEARTPSEVLPVLSAVRDGVKRGYWAAGFLSYEAASGIDPLWVTRPPGPLPLAAFGLFTGPESAEPMRVSEYQLDPLKMRSTRADYAAAISAIQEQIRLGYTYQVNHTVRMEADFNGDAMALYRALQSQQQGAYGAYADLGRFAVACASPELFFRIDGRTVSTRPMKGTSRRGRFPAEDAQIKAQLQQSPKDRAENVMIVDLIRNDLSKVAQLGSVVVDGLWAIEQYPTVFQMVSTVNATLLPQHSWYDVLLALFPSGSVTGAPKASTMRIIRDLEADPREIYCGTMGYIDPNQDAVFNVAIRTVTVDRERQIAKFSAGGGITADSTEALEYAEVEAKARFVRTPDEPVELLETMRLDEGRYWLWGEHRARMEASARFLGYAFSEPAWTDHLQTVATANPRGRWRVRVRLRPTGELVVESWPWSPAPGISQRVAWAESPVPADEVWMCHKSTRRAPYQRWHPESSVEFDHLLWDGDGHATEFTRGNLVIERDGKLFTPPVACGLLGGTLRQWLLDRALIHECVVPRERVEQAQQIWFINSLEGWVPVRIGERAEP